MTYRLLFLWSCLIAVSAANQKTNILLLLTDDQDVLLGSFDTASYMPIVHERLQQKGITFEKGGLVHVPICCPSRSSLLTGKYLHRGSLAKNNSFEGDCYSRDWKTHEEDHHTLAVHAQAAGYTTLYAGKYLNRYGHNKTNIQDSIPKGWDYWLGLEGNSRYYNYTLVEKKPGSSQVQLHPHGDSYPEDYLPLVMEEYTLSVLPILPEPWLAIVAWPTPHGPFTPEPKYSDRYPGTESPKNKDFNATSDSQLAKHWLLRQLGVISNQTASLMEEIYRNRLRALKTVDDHIGKLLDWLETTDTKISTTGEERDESTTIEALPQRNLGTESKAIAEPMIDRTFILYTSDNGFQFGQHRLSIDKVR